MAKMTNGIVIIPKGRGWNFDVKDTRPKKVRKADNAKHRTLWSDYGFVGSPCTRIVPDKKKTYSRARNKAETRTARYAD